MAVRRFTAPSGLSFYALLTKATDGTTWQTTTDTAVTFVAANIANYDLALSAGQTSQDSYSYTIPAALTVGAWIETIYEYTTPGTPSITDEIVQPGIEFTWNGTGIVSPITGSNTMSVGTARDLLVESCRSAGLDVSDLTNGPYSLTNIDSALKRLFSDWIRNTHCTQRTDSVAIADGETAIDFSSISGFSRERFVDCWIDGEEAPEMTNISHLIDERGDGEEEGVPRLFAFTSQTDAEMFPESDGSYTLRVMWWAPLVTWTSGTSGDSVVVLNIQADICETIVFLAGAYYLQASEVEQLPSLVARFAEYKALRDRHSSVMSLQSKTINLGGRPVDPWGAGEGDDWLSA